MKTYGTCFDNTLYLVFKMSDGTGDQGNSEFNGLSSKSASKRTSNGDDSDSDENTNQLDVGLGSQPQTIRKNTSECQAGPSEIPRREENPFSFKHFLSRENINGLSNSHNIGTKPKLFTSSVLPHSSDQEYNRSLASSRNFTNPDLASALPDFVQDHLVVEQCFLRDGGSSNFPVDIDNLPDFAVTNDITSNASGGARPRQSNLNNFARRRGRNLNGLDNMPLDLPSGLSPPSSNDGPGPGVLPFDLPLVRDVNAANASGMNGLANGPGQPTVSKTLPDFLSDGPIRGGHLPPADVTAEASGVSQNHASEERFQTENERLRAEIELLRGQNSELSRRFQTENERLRAEIELLRGQNLELSRRVQSLQTEVRTLQAREHEDTTTMEKAMEQAEENLQRTMKRAVNAENTVLKLKQELKQAQSENKMIRQENWELRGGDGASGSSAPTSDQQIQMQRFAQELKAAATSAEASLRTLLSGVDNLRLLASNMETVDRVEDRTQDYLSDSDDAAGPTL